MSKRRLITALSLVLATLSPLSGARAAQGGYMDLAPPSLEQARPVEQDLRAMQRGCMSLSEAVSRARRQYPNGRIISAETRGGRHQVKVLTGDGKVRTLRFPACG